MVRHGQSVMNAKDVICGWCDCLLTKKGIEDARNAGKILNEQKYTFDLAYTSFLSRARTTLRIILNELNLTNIPIKSSWRLNERHWGGVSGLTKDEAMKEFGEEALIPSFRTYEGMPPKMEPNHPLYDAIINNPRYKGLEDRIPKAESLKNASERVVPLWKNNICRDVTSGRKVLIAAHETILRCIVQNIENISNEDILKRRIPRCIPFAIKIDQKCQVTSDGKLSYLADPGPIVPNIGFR